MLAALLLLVVSHDAVARGELRRLERFEDRLSLVVEPGRKNLISDAAAAELRRWPGLVRVRISPPLDRLAAAQLRKLRRLAVELPAGAPRRGSGVELLGPALVRVAHAKSTGPAAPGPCEGTTLAPGEEPVLTVADRLGECVPDWLAAQLDPHAGPPGDPPPEPAAGSPQLAPPLETGPKRRR